MKIVIIGNGGREHALCQSLINSKKTNSLYCIPGNAGTNSIAQNIDLDPMDFEEIKRFVQKNKIDIVIVGPEQPLVNGIVDYLEKYDIKVLVQTKLQHS